jgi:hypothetical protein
MARKPPEPVSRESPSSAGARRGRPPGKAARPSFTARASAGQAARGRGRAPAFPRQTAGESAIPARVGAAHRQVRPRSGDAAGQRPTSWPLHRRDTHRADAADPGRAGRAARHPDRGAGARHQARRRVARQVGSPGERDPGDAVPPGVAVQSPAPLNATDQAALEKLEPKRRFLQSYRLSIRRKP